MIHGYELTGSWPQSVRPGFSTCFQQEGSRMHFTESLQIDAPPETVFAAINDYGRRLEWDTLLRTAEVLSVDGHIVNCSTPIVPGMRVRSYAR